MFLGWCGGLCWGKEGFLICVCAGWRKSSRESSGGRRRGLVCRFLGLGEEWGAGEGAAAAWIG